MLTPESHAWSWEGKFFTVWTGQALSLVGSALVQFALVWWLTQKTGSATILATATLVALLPQIFLSPFAGTFVDRLNRKAVMIVSDGVIALATLVLMVLFAIGKEQLWHVYVILLVRSAGGAFHQPAMSASTALMVPKEHLARISGLNQMLQGVISIVSPPLGALLLGLLPTQGVLSIDIVTAALAISLLAVVSIPQSPRLIAQANGVTLSTSYWQDLREGWRYMLRWPGLLGLAILAMLINFFLSPAGALMPLMVTKAYQGGVTELGWVESVFGVGVIAGGLTLSAWGGFKKRIMTSMMGVIGIGLGILLFGILPSEWFLGALGGVFLFGFMQVLANGPLNAIFQATVDPDVQGRVMALIGAGATAMMPLSLLIAGPFSDAIGVRSWYMIGGIASILMAIVSFFIPVIMNIEENKQ
jgi:DHA3 family macrolide efflux protein-like MFS transporter